MKISKKLQTLIDNSLIELKELQDEEGDWEIAHARADSILCEILMEYGRQDIVDAYKDVPKWYA